MVRGPFEVVDNVPCGVHRGTPRDLETKVTRDWVPSNTRETGSSLPG